MDVFERLKNCPLTSVLWPTYKLPIFHCLKNKQEKECNPERPKKKRIDPQIVWNHPWNYTSYRFERFDSVSDLKRARKHFTLVKYYVNEFNHPWNNLSYKWHSFEISSTHVNKSPNIDWWTLQILTKSKINSSLVLFFCLFMCCVARCIFFSLLYPMWYNMHIWETMF